MGCCENCSCEHCCKCTCRVITAIICLPILLVFGLLAIVLAIIACPLKCCCPCLAPCIQGILDLTFYILKAPFRLIMWSVGRATAEDDDDASPLQDSESGGKDYGSSPQEDGQVVPPN